MRARRPVFGIAAARATSVPGSPGERYPLNVLARDRIRNMRIAGLPQPIDSTRSASRMLYKISHRRLAFGVPGMLPPIAILAKSLDWSISS